MPLLSIIIPTHKEPFLKKTVDSIFDSATGDIEVIVIIDGYDIEEQLDPRTKIIKFENNKGMRAAINAGIEKAKGEFILKVDAHILFEKGFDEILTKDCQKDWLMIPKRYALDEVNWVRESRHKVVDYQYLSFPSNTGKFGYIMFVLPYSASYHHAKKSKLIDDTMTFQGSCWMANREYFLNLVGKLDDKNYSSFAAEQTEIGLKYWLVGGGAVKVNKKTWYAHLSKDKAFHISNGKSNYNMKRSSEVLNGWQWAAKHWINNEEPNMCHPFEWLIEKFHPVPGWEKNWKDVLKSYNI